MRQAVFILTTTAIIILIINTGAVLSNRKKTPADPKLDMAPDSVDDQFKDCVNGTYKLIINEVLKEDLNKSKEFNKSWETSEEEEEASLNLLHADSLLGPALSLDTSLEIGFQHRSKKGQSHLSLMVLSFHPFVAA
ncbi:hypothetical protein Q7C36_002741 [Tachysurus vachellii]|uniref:NAD(P)(+)--arginine ADP-ribosyltransferase n=1 Tax=Tachysurus vachellii TaxID=175792 RepID=A0AA88NYE5_TACVA|nr:hypothetical protein Q7C36_002741 [Tachysurus vachellii]